MASASRCLNRLARRSLPSLMAARQSISNPSLFTIPASFAISPLTSSSTTIVASCTNSIVSPAVSASACTTKRMLSASSTADEKHEGNNVEHAMTMLAKADAVCFDVDSTVIDEEGIDVLADTLGKGPEVAAWTVKAMDGNIKFEDALAARLEIIKPSQSDIASCLEKHPLRLSPGVDTLISALHARGTHVYLVSGGFRLMIEPVAEILGVSKDRIYANTILFSESGEYVGFDANEPTSADRGKPKALEMIKAKFGYKTMIMVGDGATDAQAKPPADAFIGFGGVITRQAVKEKACWFVKDFNAMIDIVEGK